MNIDLDRISDIPDMDVEEALGILYAEAARRATLRAIPTAIEEAAAAWREASPREDWDEYVEPTRYHDAYSFDALVTHEGKRYKATRNGAVGIPGQSPDWWQVSIDQPVKWVRHHAGSEYPVGAEVIHKGKLWRNDHTAPNRWEPGTVGSKWTDIGQS